MTIKRTAVASGTSYAVQTNDYLIAVTSANTNNTVTVTLPSAATVQSGKIYLIKGERTTGKITVNSTSGTVEGAASFDLSKNQGAQFYSDGSNWWILSLP
jgi:hypothetical protein